MYQYLNLDNCDSHNLENLKDIEDAVGVPLSMKASNALHHEQYEIYDY